MKPTALVFDERYYLHDTGPEHPERPARVKAIWDHLQKTDFFPKLLLLKSEPAGREWIEKVHDPGYIERVKEVCESGADYIDTPDTAVSPESFGIALLAVGGVLRLVDTVLKGEARNGFALVRPPGHHAERNRAEGFCLFNNVAVGVRYAQAKYHVKKVLIVDWDVHHGNGTQNCFESDPNVFYFSAHQYPFYPGTGHAWEKGAGRGQGATLNIPLPSGVAEREYLEAFNEVFMPIAREFGPHLIFVSAGFDAHRDDPLASLTLTEHAYAEMTRRLKTLETAKERIVSVLEGGYNLEALARSVEAHLRALLE